MIVVNPDIFMPDAGLFAAFHKAFDADIVSGKGAVLNLHIPDAPGGIPEFHQIIQAQTVAVVFKGTAVHNGFLRGAEAKMHCMLKGAVFQNGSRRPVRIIQHIARLKLSDDFLCKGSLNQVQIILDKGIYYGAVPDFV